MMALLLAFAFIALCAYGGWRFLNWTCDVESREYRRIQAKKAAKRQEK